MSTRRQFLRRAGFASAAFALPTSSRAFPKMPLKQFDPVSSVVRNEGYWEEVAAQYEVSTEVTNLEGGYWGMMARPVLEAFHRHTDRVNRESSFYARTRFDQEASAIGERIASTLGVSPGEIAFSRNATEALQALISQYNRLEPGETVMYADLDYPAMQQAMSELASRRGAKVATLVIPEPVVSREQVIQTYTDSLNAHPKTRLLLLTHANNKTGLIHPVREITALARSRGIDVIVDAAHSWGHVPLDLAGFGADYVGLNLHKWIGAPLGVGAMYIRESGLSGIDRAHGDPGSLESIQSRLHTGTMNFATILSIPDALDFQESVGWENKFARVRYLRDLWVSEARTIDGVDILTPDDDELVGAITSFRLNGRGEGSENRELVQQLVDTYGIFTVARTGVAGGDCIRVTPALYNLPADLEKIVGALRELAGK
ncbi:MAG: aminotransferase class V-fold PLP-dependent enzyme [Rhodothermales bacterium]|nr:aminotransferase class V-fold PLP-dependent enzyme [Rhodothermales bacterium]MDG2015932.1 aminotransferase class V-fold PLP-dependent enzyme [Rhodothermales bacterium]